MIRGGDVLRRILDSSARGGMKTLNHAMLELNTGREAADLADR